MIDLTLEQLIAGKTALFRVCEDPEFDDVRALVNAVFPGEQEKHQELLQAIRDRQAIEKLHTAAADELERIRAMMRMVTGRDDWQRMITEECEAMPKDAARYRWLRDPATDCGLVIDKISSYSQDLNGTPYPNYEYRAGDELDAAIDSAMPSPQKTGSDKWFPQPHTKSPTYYATSVGHRRTTRSGPTWTWP